MRRKINHIGFATPTSLALWTPPCVLTTSGSRSGVFLPMGNIRPIGSRESAKLFRLISTAFPDRWCESTPEQVNVSPSLRIDIAPKYPTVRLRAPKPVRVTTYNKSLTRTSIRIVITTGDASMTYSCPLLIGRYPQKQHTSDVSWRYHSFLISRDRRTRQRNGASMDPHTGLVADIHIVALRDTACRDTLR